MTSPLRTSAAQKFYVGTSTLWMPHHQTPGLLPPARSPPLSQCRRRGSCRRDVVFESSLRSPMLSGTARIELNFYPNGHFSSLLHYVVDLGPVFGCNFYSHLQFVHGFTNTTSKSPSLYKACHQQHHLLPCSSSEALANLCSLNFYKILELASQISEKEGVRLYLGLYLIYRSMLVNRYLYHMQFSNSQILPPPHSLAL